MENFNYYYNNKDRVIIPTHFQDNNNRLLNEIIMHKNIMLAVKKYLLELTEEEKGFDIELLMSDAKKIFDGVKFTQRSINSAQYNGDTNKLTIFRKEELSKSIFHELIHRIEMDKMVDINNIEMTEWFNKWRVDKSKDFMFYETLTETFAEFINLVVTSKICKIDFLYLLKYELFFGIFQTAKILYLAGFKKCDDFINLNSDIKIITNTSTVEYHIFKTICMINFNEFLKIYIKFKQSKFMSNEQMIKHNLMVTNEMLNMIYNFYNDNVIYRKMLDELINVFNNGFDKNTFLFKTARMTIIDRLL